MTKGTLRKALKGGTQEASVGPDGWESADKVFADRLSRLYPAGGTPAGCPWVAAFWAAAKGLGAEAVTEPEPDAEPAGRVF